MINKRRLIRLTRRLIQIDSQNPPGDEREIAGFIKGYLAGFGLKARIYQFKKNRANLVAVIPGAKRKKSLLITPHSDTVPRGNNWHFPPFAARVSGGRIYGLGATDCKGNLACGLEAINSLAEEGIKLDYDLVFAATADEESGSKYGLIPLLKKNILKPDAAVVLDSDDFKIVVAQKGLIHLKIKISGRKAHGAYPWRGINAIDIALRVLGEIKKQKFSYRPHAYLRAPTLNIGTIRGGDKVNVVSDWCEFELDIRFLPGMSAAAVLRQIKKAASRHTRNFKLAIEDIQKPYQIDKGQPLVKYLVRASRNTGAASSIEGSEGATTITFFQERSIPAVATGFGAAGCCHICDEYAGINSLYRGALMLEEFLKIYRF